ncbi:M3 family metallopeptidase [Rivibacter subsaxonicus]|uniref:Thimet oligopeptidase n=1 Tax=Rivibacter subsaxonicus TaxID=457575 RepID=A0A4Q7V7I3_9BURK|nr:M3 family metallopeptidase [Rivibacter subsaxonicus]RZT91420.1 thimet oligopeptidase [Rivibacter subsaxonicus]
MKRSLLPATVATLMLLASAAAGAAPFVFPSFATGAELKKSCDAALAELATQAKRLERSGEVLSAFDRLNQTTEDRVYPLIFLPYVHPDKAIRAAGEACELRHQAFVNKLNQNPRIHARLKAAKPADAVDAQLQRILLASFEDAGVALPSAARARAEKLNNEIAALGQAFDRQLREETTRVAFTEAELEGVPADVWTKATRDAQGRVLLGLDYPSAVPVMESATNPAARERMWRAFNQRGGQPNLERLAGIADKRREYAALFDLPSYSDFVLRRRMAGTPVAAQAFLAEVKSGVEAREKGDIEELRKAKAADLKQPLDAVKLQRWDSAFYSERVKRERYNVDQEAFRKYFPPQASVDFVVALSSHLFGVSLRPLEQKLWHPDARAYEVVDGASGRGIATLVLDLYPRDNKFNHAAVWGLRGSAAGGRLPTAAMVTNFNRKGLTLDELETLLHEFGHALHGTLSATRYATIAGTNVKTDFVEAPSQMLEEWVYDDKVLAMFQQVCKECQPVPAPMLQSARDARGFGKGLQYGRQHLYATYDLGLYGPKRFEPMALWAQMEGATPLGHVDGSRFPASFSHIATNYGAGYYSYLWSLAVAKDLYTAFAADPLSAEVGRRYRSQVLARGGEAEPSVLVADFLGRPGGSKAFFDWLAQ